MNTEFFTALDLLEKERGVPAAYMIEKIEAALLSAFKKEYGELYKSFTKQVASKRFTIA